ncbi:unnamed protein product [Pseudo-nitzschia multistriata]|uniref:SET domain-containing protein n=1 Tax=Pseudo-nitzschia multistriata TaxID=183589 RepID=A0A448ZSQ4_9STRA|nr:unnamed protein product [Pseudo-nitzschia multistriata]
MILSGWSEILVFSIVLPLVVTPSSTIAFTSDVNYSTRRICRATGKNSFSSALAAGGFGKAPAPSSKKKKKNKKKQKQMENAVPPYIPYDSYPNNVASGANDSGSPSTKQQTSDFLDWLEEEEIEGLDGVEIGFSKLGTEIGASDNDTADDNFLRGVFARQNFRAGEYIMAVPFVSTILLDEEFDATRKPGETVLRADAPEIGLHLLKTINESNFGGNFRAFLDCLPTSPDDPNFDATPDFWSEKDVRKLEIPGVIDSMLSRKASIAALSADQSEPGDAPTLRQCCWMVQSRAFTTYKKAVDLLGNEGLLSRVVLIPFIDMINHGSRGTANAEMQVVETKEYDESFYALVATKPIRKGEEVRLCYGTGEETALELFCKYGFLPGVDDPDKERKALGKLLEGVEWSTTLEEDRAMLSTDEGSREPMRTILSIRIYAKSLFA